MNSANLNNNMHVEFFCVESNSFVKSSSLAIIEIHCHIYLQIMFVSFREIRKILGRMNNLVQMKVLNSSRLIIVILEHHFLGWVLRILVTAIPEI